MVKVTVDEFVFKKATALLHGVLLKMILLVAFSRQFAPAEEVSFTVAVFTVLSIQDS